MVLYKYMTYKRTLKDTQACRTQNDLAIGLYEYSKNFIKMSKL